MSPISSKNSVPPSACSNLPPWRVVAGKGAFFVAEQFAFDQLAGDRGHVDGDEGTGFAAAEIVQCFGDQFFAGAGLTGNQHGEVGRGEAAHHPINILHSGRATDDGHDLFVVLAGAENRRNTPCAVF